MSPFIAEIVGTMILIILGDGVVANVLLNKSKGQNSGWIITTGWGLAVAMAVYAVGWISGAHINPAVTIGLAAIGKFPWSQVPGYIIAQMIGGFLGGVIVSICRTGPRRRIRGSSWRSSAPRRPFATTPSTCSLRSSAPSCWWRACCSSSTHATT